MIDHLRIRKTVATYHGYIIIEFCGWIRIHRIGDEDLIKIGFDTIKGAKQYIDEIDRPS